MTEAKQQLAVGSLDGFEPEIGRWLWALEDVVRQAVLTHFRHMTLTD